MNQKYSYKTKEGRTANMREWRKKNPEKWHVIVRRKLDKQKAARHARGLKRSLKGRDPIKLRNTKLRRYGIDYWEYQRLLGKQGLCCAICGTFHDEHAPLGVDHSHKTGAVRGLLCRNCNAGIGLLQDSPEILTKAAAYIAGELGG